MADHLPAPREDEPPRRNPPDPEQIRQVARVAGVVLAVAIVLAFIIENAGTVEFSFVFFKADISLFVLLVLTFVMGAITGILADRLLWRRYTRDR